MAEDILLTVGISLESIKKATAQIERELKTFKAPSALDLAPGAKKQLSDTEKFAKAVKSEFSKLGQSIAKDNLSSYFKIDQNATKNITDGAKRASDAFKVVSEDTLNAETQLQKLATTTSFYKSKNDLMGISLANTKSELSAYLKVEAQGITLDATAAARKTELLLAYNQLNQKGGADVQLKKLAETTTYYKSKNDLMGVSLASTTAELSSYLKVEQQGITLDATAAARKQELTERYQKLSAAQNNFFHGIDLGRLALWAVGWKVLYGSINFILEQLGNLVQTIKKVNEVLLVTRVVNQETAHSFDTTYATIRNTIYKTAEFSSISIQQLTNAYKTLIFEGQKSESAAKTIQYVRSLMVLTGEREDTVAQALIETYELFGNKVKNAATESERFARITDSLAALFTKAHISVGEYQQVMGFIAPTAAESVDSLDDLVQMLIFADKHMLGGRRAGAALLQTLSGLTESSQKLAEVFGITFNSDEVITIGAVLDRIKESVKDLSVTAQKDILGKLFKGASLTIVLDYIRSSKEALAATTQSIEGMAQDTERAFNKAHWLGIATKQFWQDITWIVHDLGGWISTHIYQPLGEALNMVKKTKNETSPPKKYSRLDFATGKEIPITKEQYLALTGQKNISNEIDNSTKNTQKFNAALTNITPELRKQLSIIEHNARLKLLESQNVTATTLASEKARNVITEVAELVGEQGKKEQLINDLYNAREESAQTIVGIVKAYGLSRQDDKDALEVANKLIDIRNDKILALQEETKNLANITLQENSQLLQMYEASGASLQTILAERRKIALEKVGASIVDVQQRETAINALYAAREQSTTEIYRIARENNVSSQVANEYINELIETRFEIYKQMISEVKGLADELQQTSADYLNDIFHGELDPTEYLSSIMDAYKSTLSENIMQMFEEKTGIFSNMATAFMSPLQKAHYTGIKDAVPMIIKAHIEGIQQGTQEVNALTSGTTNTSTQNTSGGILDTVMNFFGGNKTQGTQASTGSQYALIKDAKGITSAVPVKSSGVNATSATGSSGMSFGQVGGAALSIASFASEMANAYKAKGSGNPWGTGMSLGTSGAIAGSAFGPIGTIIGGVVGGVYGFIQGARSKTTEETKTQTIEIASKINITNKELQIVNRNLEGILRGFEGYIMPRSAYFSERPGVEERFNLDKNRGYYG